MFHSTYGVAISGQSQEPGQGETGYEVSGEAWIKDRVLTFSCSVVTSYIDLETGKQLSADTVKNYTKITSNGMYSTSGKSELGGYITPSNASNFFQAGTTNVVYLYDGSDPVTPVGDTTLGDVDYDGRIAILDATYIQRYLAQLQELTDKAKTAADTDESGNISILDATYIQRHLAQLENTASVGKVIGGTAQGEHTFDELIEMYNTLSAKYLALPADYYKQSEEYMDVYNAAGVALDTYKPVTLNPTASAEEIDKAYDAFETAYNTIKDLDEDVEIPLPDTIDIYFSNNWGWSNVYCYIWGTAGESAAWPGPAMEYVTTNDMGEKIYKVSIDPTKYQNIIFTNNSGTQTVDIALDTTKTNVGYYLSGGSGKSCTVGTYDYVG